MKVTDIGDHKMKLFENQTPVERKEPERPVVDNAAFIKRNLMKSVDRNPEVYKAVEDWLFSFVGGISKVSFQAQLKRLDWNDEVALSQLEKAKGRRVIPLPPPPKMPALPKPLVEQMLEDTYVAVYGRKFKPAIKEVVAQLKECGNVFVLQMEDLILQFKDYYNKGKSPQMIEQAIECDFLVIVDLEMTIHLEWHIVEAIERIGRMREAKQKPIISTWNRYNDCNKFFERFKIYCIE